MSAALDMSVLCRDWKPSLKDRYTVASMPMDKELTLSLSLRPDGDDPLGTSNLDPRVLILSAHVDDVVLWELRFWDGRLRLNAGTGPAQESECTVLGATSFDFAISFQPYGGLAIAARWLASDDTARRRTFAANISNLKLPEARYYTLRLGAPKHFVDQSLLGWSVTATFDLVPSAGLLEFVPAHAVEVGPDETLRAALLSIDHWLKAAQAALDAKGDGNLDRAVAIARRALAGGDKEGMRAALREICGLGRPS